MARVADNYPKLVEDKEVLLVRNEVRLHARLRCLLDGYEGPRPHYRIELSLNGDRLTATASDVFESLVRLRHQLEPSGLMIAVQGARRDTYPSGMQRDMGGGSEVYVLRPGQKGSPDDAVRTLDDAEVEQLGTVAEQQAFHAAWIGKK